MIHAEDLDLTRRAMAAAYRRGFRNGWLDAAYCTPNDYAGHQPDSYGNGYRAGVRACHDHVADVRHRHQEEE
jgi:hypothetical protein